MDTSTFDVIMTLAQVGGLAGLGLWFAYRKFVTPRALAKRSLAMSEAALALGLDMSEDDNAVHGEVDGVPISIGFAQLHDIADPAVVVSAQVSLPMEAEVRVATTVHEDDLQMGERRFDARFELVGQWPDLAAHLPRMARARLLEASETWKIEVSGGAVQSSRGIPATGARSRAPPTPRSRSRG